MIPLDADYGALIVDVLTEQIAGYYDPEDEKLYIAKNRPACDAGGADMVLAHEIDHALQDQHFDLEKFDGLPLPRATRCSRAARSSRATASR